MNNKYKMFLTVFIISLNILLVFEYVVAQPTVELLKVPDIETLYIGSTSQKILLTARVKGEISEFKWKLEGPGELEENKRAIVSYIPPDRIEGDSAEVVITVTVTDDSGEKATDSVVFTLYPKVEDGYQWPPFIPFGWMPDGGAIALKATWEGNCHSGKTCIRIGFDTTQKLWGGVYWLAQGNWEGPGIDIYDHLQVREGTPIKLTFWARGEKGGEKAQFKMGGVTTGNDSVEFPVETDYITLEKDWKQYEIDLSDEDLSNVIGGFCWVTSRDKNPGKELIWIFLDDIRYEVQ